MRNTIRQLHLKTSRIDMRKYEYLYFTLLQNEYIKIREKSENFFPKLSTYTLRNLAIPCQ